MTHRPRLYLAGPTVFLPDRDARGAALKRLCAAAGCEGLWPLDADFGPSPTARTIANTCLALLARADAVVADLSPFRGPHVDDGTAFELGFAAARGLPIFGYSDDLRPLADRIAPRAPGESVDAASIAIEDAGEAFNAMIGGTLSQPVFATAGEAIGAAAVHLRARGGGNDIIARAEAAVRRRAERDPRS